LARGVGQADVAAAPLQAGSADSGPKLPARADSFATAQASDGASPSRAMRALKAAMVLVLLASAGVGGGIAYKLGAARGGSAGRQPRSSLI
jgi:hypothetical protein